MKRFPLVTVALVLAVLLAFSAELAGGGMAVCEARGLVPARFVRTGDFGPVLYSLFLHDPANLLHVGGNVLFLAAFGTLVEGSLGHLRFLVAYLAAGVGGALLHVLVDPAATDPLVGCSGALFGVMALAAVLRPRLLGFVGSYAALNVYYALSGAGGSISAGCHLGGFAVGVAFAAVLRMAGDDCLESA